MVTRRLYIGVFCVKNHSFYLSDIQVFLESLYECLPQWIKSEIFEKISSMTRILSNIFINLTLTGCSRVLAMGLYLSFLQPYVST